MNNLQTKSTVEVIELNSKILTKEMKINVYLPYGYDHERAYPVLYFLHGRDSNHNIVHFIGMNKVADSLIQSGQIKPMIIVFPQIDNSHGINSSELYTEVTDPTCSERIINLGRYEDYFFKEMIPLIQSKYYTDRENCYIGGISGGGYAALHLAFNHPNLFSKVGGHMPAIELDLQEDDKPFYPDEQSWLRYNPITIAKHNTIENIKVYLDCGNQDEGEFYNGCDLLYRYLKDKNVDVQYNLFDGGHNLIYITENLENYLRFYSE